MFYFIIVIFTFILAIFIFPDFLNKFLANFQGSPQAEILILLLSIGALVAVSFMLVIRLVGLRSKALTTFKFLVILDAIKTEKERFDKSLKEIEQYLTNGDWTLAEIWINRVILEDEDLIREKFKTA